MHMKKIKFGLTPTPGDETKLLSEELASVSSFKFLDVDGISVSCASRNTSSGKMVWLIGQMPVDLKPARIFEVAALVNALEANSGNK